MTTATSTDIAEIVEGLRHRLGGDEQTSSGPAQDPGCWPADPTITGERAVARHAKDKETLVRWAAELRRPQVAVPAVAALAAVGAGIAWVVRD